MSVREAAAQTGHSYVHISRLRRGESGNRLQKETREQIEAYLRSAPGSIAAEPAEDGTPTTRSEQAPERITQSRNTDLPAPSPTATPQARQQTADKEKLEEYLKALASRFLEVVAPLTNRQAAAHSGLSHMLISRLRSDKFDTDRMTPSTIQLMEAYLRAHTDEGTAMRPVEEGKAPAYFVKVLRRVSGSGNAQNAKLRRLDALEGLRRFYSATGVVPDWWFSLREQVEAGEI